MAERKTAKPKTFEQISALFHHSVPGLFDLCLTNSSPIPRGVAARYAEEGAELIRTCTKQLDEAEQTVVKLQKGADGAPVETSFVSENE